MPASSVRGAGAGDPDCRTADATGSPSTIPIARAFTGGALAQAPAPASLGAADQAPSSTAASTTRTRPRHQPPRTTLPMTLN